MGRKIMIAMIIFLFLGMKNYALAPIKRIETKKIIIIQENTIQAIPSLIRKYRMIDAIVTAYNPHPKQTDDTPFITASGKKVREGIIANNCLRFGTIVEIENKLYVVEDRMNKRYGCERFDILMFSYQKAKNFGKKKVIVKIYE